MGLTYGILSLPAILSAFASGVFGAAVGGTQGFVILGLAGIGSIALNDAGVSFLSSTIFGMWLNPPFWFAPCEIATAYAGKRGYWHNPKDVNKCLLALRKPDVLFVGGLSGVAAYLLFLLLRDVVGLNGDQGAAVIILMPLILKIITEKTVFGKPSSEVAAKGGRFSCKHDEHWITTLHQGPEKLIWGLAWATLQGFCCWEIGTIYGATEDLSIWASNSPAYFAFFVSALSLVFAISSEAAPSHHITLSAGYAFCSCAAAGGELTTAFVWAIGFGIFACFLADFGADALTVHGSTYIDPPAMANLTSSLVCFNLPASILKDTTVPIVLIAACVVLAFTYYKPAKLNIPSPACSAMQPNEE